jgi:hypothetical protein
VRVSARGMTRCYTPIAWMLCGYLYWVRACLSRLCFSSGIASFSGFTSLIRSALLPAGLAVVVCLPVNGLVLGREGLAHAVILPDGRKPRFVQQSRAGQKRYWSLRNGLLLTSPVLTSGMTGCHQPCASGNLIYSPEITTTATLFTGESPHHWRSATLCLSGTP